MNSLTFQVLFEVRITIYFLKQFNRLRADKPSIHIWLARKWDLYACLPVSTLGMLGYCALLVISWDVVFHPKFLQMSFMFQCAASSPCPHLHLFRESALHSSTENGLCAKETALHSSRLESWSSTVLGSGNMSTLVSVWNNSRDPCGSTLCALCGTPPATTFLIATSLWLLSFFYPLFPSDKILSKWLCLKLLIGSPE